MKYHGCIMEFTCQRNGELMRAFRKAVSEAEHIDIARIAETVVNTPCSRFWVSEERALVVVSAIRKGKDVLRSMRPTKREMFEEIYRRVCDRKRSRPKDRMTDIIFHVVNSPAPKFYMRPRCAMELIYKIKKGYYDK